MVAAPGGAAGKPIVMDRLAMSKGWALVLIVGSGLLAYHNVLGHSFHYDDDHSIVESPHVRSLANVPQIFVDPGTFKTRVDKAVQQIHACRRAPGIDRLYAPGELEFIQHHEYSRDGIPLTPVTLADLARVARDMAVDSKPFPWLPRN